MTRLIGIHHFGLTVSNMERSAVWYGEVLDFVVTGRFESPGGERRKILLDHSGLGVRLGLVEHDGNSKRPFEETACGLDHLAFRVAGHVELEWRAQRFVRHGVRHSPIAAANSIPGARVLVLRDPDNIQLELFA